MHFCTFNKSAAKYLGEVQQNTWRKCSKILGESAEKYLGKNAAKI